MLGETRPLIPQARRSRCSLHRLLAGTIVDCRNYRRTQPLQWNKKTVKGATVNRELACLHCIFQFALKRKYIGDNPTSGVKHFDEPWERPSKPVRTPPRLPNPRSDERLDRRRCFQAADRYAFAHRSPFILHDRR